MFLPVPGREKYLLFRARVNKLLKEPESKYFRLGRSYRISQLLNLAIGAQKQP